MCCKFVIRNRDGELIVDLKTSDDFRNSVSIDNINDFLQLYLKAQQ